jgi:hypothetical protein
MATRFAVVISLLAFAGPSWTGWAGEATMQERPKTLFTFDTDTEARWQVVNDGVMGGRSQGFVAIEDGTLRFTGTLVTRGGGFTSVRTDRSLDLEGYAGVELRVRGNGRTFEVEVADQVRFRGRPVSRRAPFATSEEWAIVRVPFRALRATIFGQPVTVPPLELPSVQRVGLYILDGQDGPFQLEVDWMRAYRSDDSARR